MVFPDALAGLARDGHAGSVALRVLVWSWQNLSHEKFDLILQEQVAAELLMSSAAVRKGLHRLLAEGILERTGRGARQMWRVTPVASWRGGAAAYQQSLRPRVSAAVASAQAELARPKRPARRRAKHGADEAFE